MVNLSDYRGREIAFYEPSQYDAAGLPSLYQPLIIVPGLRIGDSLESIRFVFREASEYVRTWSDYPKRRRRTFDEHDADEKT